MRGALGLLAALAVATAARRIDQDFEFDDDAEGAVRRPRRYLYDPHSPLCRALVCARREECVLRDAGTALCADRARLLRNGDVVVNANESDGETRVKSDPESDWSRDDDVFYETAPESREPELDRIGLEDRAGPESDRAGHCVGCGSVPRAQFLCGSDNRTYSSLCRLDLHNCVRRPAPPVSLACRGFCPCSAPAPPARVRSRPRAHAHSEHREHDARDEHDEWRRRGRRRNRRPSAIRDNAIPARRRPTEGEGCALDKMADRLLDWFSVLMGDAGASPPDRRGFPRDCKPETRWMFAHLDTDNDDLLSSAELYALRHDDRERCLRPFLASCGAAGDAAEGEDAGVTRAAWCGCLRRAARPCTALARAHAAAPGAYVPACDAAGYYRPRQCHAALGVCWCVDAHGQEVPGSRGKGAPTCPGRLPVTSSFHPSTGRPCTALARAHAAAPGAYVPACDAAGYYRPRQCHAALGVCWCVDAHGQEVPGSRGKGAPTCPGRLPVTSSFHPSTGRPCTALARAHAAALGAYVPACDAAGYYRPRQCHAALGVCWCVDAHGQEVPGSRGKGAPTCPGDKLSANAISLSNETGEEAQEAQEARERGSHRSHEAHETRGAPSDDEDALASGSGDSELRF